MVVLRRIIILPLCFLVGLGETSLLRVSRDIERDVDNLYPLEPAKIIAKRSTSLYAKEDVENFSVDDLNHSIDVLEQKKRLAPVFRPKKTKITSLLKSDSDAGNEEEEIPDEYYAEADDSETVTKKAHKSHTTTEAPISSEEEEDEEVKPRNNPSHRKFITHDESEIKVEKVKIALLNPKSPLDLPIVKPELEKLENEPEAKLIFTKIKPFHFHIPLFSKNPVDKLSMDDLMDLAKTYKNPLTLDPEVYMAAAAGQILSEQEVSLRSIRHSPALEALRIAFKVDSGQLDSLSDDGLVNKRSPVIVPLTDDIIQELTQDNDDLKNPIAETESKRSPAKSEEVNPLHAEDGLFPSNILRRRRNFLQNLKQLRGSHHRAKRGIGKWFKKIFGFGKETTTPTTTTTTTTTTRRPPPKPSSSSSSSSESNEKKRRKKLKKKLKKKAKKNQEAEVDENGDSEVDFLLPADLRRSSWLQRHPDPYNDDSKSGDTGDEEPN